MQRMLKIVSFKDEILGKSTKTEPIVNPIMLKKVCVWYLSNKYLTSFIQQTEPTSKPTARGNRKGTYKEETESRYASYTPKSISINVLLTPGIITPADMKKPENNKYKKLKWLFPLEKSYFRSTNTSKSPKAKEKIKKNKLCIFNFELSFSLELAFFSNSGILPIISPIKIDLVWIGYA